MSYNNNNDNNPVADVIHAIAAVESSDTLDEILFNLTTYTKGFGFLHAGIGQIVNPAIYDRPITDFGITDFPEDFQEIWVKKGYVMHDPILRYALSSRSAFTWTEAYEYATRYGQKILDEGRDFGLENGFAIPVMLGRYPTGLISLSHTKPETVRQNLSSIELVCIHAYTHMLRITNAEKQDKHIALTPREIDVLHYVAAGKTNWEIGKIHDISEDAIKMHLKNITRKLDAANRAHSVSKAIRAGQILP